MLDIACLTHSVCVVRSPLAHLAGFSFVSAADTSRKFIRTFCAHFPRVRDEEVDLTLGALQVLGGRVTVHVNQLDGCGVRCGIYSLAVVSKQRCLLHAPTHRRNLIILGIAHLCPTSTVPLVQLVPITTNPTNFRTQATLAIRHHWWAEWISLLRLCRNIFFGSSLYLIRGRYPGGTRTLLIAIPLHFFWFCRVYNLLIGRIIISWRTWIWISIVQNLLWTLKNSSLLNLCRLARLRCNFRFSFLILPWFCLRINYLLIILILLCWLLLLYIFELLLVCWGVRLLLIVLDKFFINDYCAINFFSQRLHLLTLLLKGRLLLHKHSLLILHQCFLGLRTLFAIATKNE